MPDRRLPPREAWPGVLLRFVLGGLVLGLGPLGRVRAYTWDAPGETTWDRAVLLVVGAAVALSLVSFVRHRFAQPLLAIGVAAGGGAAMYPLQGKLVAVWLVATTLAAAWGVHRIRPVWFIGRPDGSAAPGLLVLAALAAKVSGDRLLAPRAGLALTAMMAMPLLLSLPYRPARFLRRRVERLAIAVGQGISIALLTLLSVVAVVVPWAAQRLIRWNPIDVSSPGGWINREPSGVQGRRMWLGPGDRGPVPVLAQLHGIASSLLTLVLLAPLALVGLGISQGIAALSSDPEPPVVEQAAPKSVVLQRIEASPWFPQMSRESQLMYERGHLSQWVGPELGEVDGRYLTVRDGRRATWTPPASTCGAAVDVWMFGGSTTFSVGARDDHTVPSALAKRASAYGVALHIVNWGVPGDVAWQEGRRLERAIGNGLALPDLVVFFDSFNDVSSVIGMGDDRAAVGDFIGPLDRLHMAALTKIGSIDDGRRVVLDFPTPSKAERTPAQTAAAAVRQYVAADESSRRYLDSYGVAQVRFAQASLWSRQDTIDGEPERAPAVHEIDRRFREALPDRIIDLGEMFEGSDRAIYNDDVHTDERGNRMIARELYRHLEPQLRLLAAKGGTPCS